MCGWAWRRSGLGRSSQRFCWAGCSPSSPPSSGTVLRIRMCLGFPDRDLLVRDTDQDPDPSIIKQKYWKKHWFLLLCNFCLTFFFKNNVNVPSKRRSLTKIAGSRSISQRYGSPGSGSVPKFHGSATLLRKRIAEEEAALQRSQISSPTHATASKSSPTHNKASKTSAEAAKTSRSPGKVSMKASKSSPTPKDFSNKVSDVREYPALTSKAKSPSSNIVSDALEPSKASSGAPQSPISYAEVLRGSRSPTPLWDSTVSDYSLILKVKRKTGNRYRM